MPPATAAYGEADVARLYRICLLRRLGPVADDIARALDDPKWSLRAAMDRPPRRARPAHRGGHRLRGRLAHLVGSTGAAKDHLTDDLLEVLEDMTMLDTTVQRRISILVYADLEAAYEFLVRVFGLGPGQLTATMTAPSSTVSSRRATGWCGSIPSPRPSGWPRPASWGRVTATMAVMVDDVDAHHRHARSEGAQIDYEPVDQPYGYREYSARDSEGQMWSFMKPLD